MDNPAVYYVITRVRNYLSRNPQKLGIVFDHAQHRAVTPISFHHYFTYRTVQYSHLKQLGGL